MYKEVAERAVAAAWCTPGIRLCDVNHWTLQVRRETWTTVHPHGDEPWDWDVILANVGRPEHFAFAIFHGDILRGLAKGHISKAREVVGPEFVEGNPSIDHPLKGNVIQIAVAAADAIGNLARARVLRLMNPAPALVEYYTQPRFGGFEVVPGVGKPHHCAREIRS
ncbi:MAG TPA: hypothetical protein VFJ82_00905 [Longimicrobium sp.]|nr:hypothetical protein [Longimicrobium sp.]